MQRQAWPAIQSGSDALIAAPTNVLILKDGVVVRTALRKQPEGMSDAPVSMVRRMSDR